MDKKLSIVILWMSVGLAVPGVASAQNLGDKISSLQGVLDGLYNDMMPLCSQLISVGRGIAGFAATWYIASRIWRHIANAEPIDFYPLFRPFVLGFAILIFPSVLEMINGVMKPCVTATSAMVTGSDQAITVLLQKKEEAIRQSATWQMYVGDAGSGDRDKWYKYTHPGSTGSDEGIVDGLGNDIKFAMAKASYNFRNSIKEWMSEVLRILYESAGLCINTIRTFYLVVLSILGPLAFGIAVFDGFQHTVTVWIARYINIFLWLPVANIFGSIIGKIQEKMIALDITQVQNSGDTFFSSSDSAYLIFMIIAITGYFTVPSVANYIVHAGGSNTLLYKVSNMFSGGISKVTNSVSGGAGMVADAFGNGVERIRGSMSSNGESAGYFKDGKADTGTTGYMHDKLSGK